MSGCRGRRPRGEPRYPLLWALLVLGLLLVALPCWAAVILAAALVVAIVAGLRRGWRAARRGR